MRTKRIVVVMLTAFACAVAKAQLKPGFDKEEYAECLRMASHMDSIRVDSQYLSSKPQRFTRTYASAERGFDNEWELWEDRGSGLTAILLRATVSTNISWTANFNAGMVRAQGTCHIGKDVHYDLCPDSTALTHAGWTACLAYMQEDILHKIDSCYATGKRDFLIAGHSQGGALSFLATAMLRRAQQKGRIASDIRFKTYCSAAPKPGDYVFAMHYEHMTRGGWSFNIINADDWVPETPLSVQRVSDFRPTNPFTQIEELMSGASLSTRIKIRFLMRKLTKPTNRAVKNLTKYLGKTVGEMLKSQRVEFDTPIYENVANFVRTGQTIVLMPTEKYYIRHPHKATDAFEHHQYNAYEELIDEYNAQ